MSFLQRLSYRPNLDGINERERETLTRAFDPASTDVVINGDAVQWSTIDEVEVALAARSRGAAGWFVRNLVMTGERYHVAFYFGREEQVLPNLTRVAAEYVVKTVAFYAPKQVRYTGPDGFAPTIEI
ncbi:MAG: hypothetical protein KA401_00725 [Anaerolineae bacterium]|nr:hypothetical protein [Chloroflexota bacterium]MBP6297840.1 hypothetical protein [Anaerolineae bacterium]